MKGNIYSVKIPATSANMGVGFDSTGLAIELYNTIHFFEIEEPLIIETDKESAEAVAEMLKTEMENVCKTAVPLSVEVKIGKTWYDTKE